MTRDRVLWILGAIGLLLVLLPVPTPAHARWQGVLEDFAHVPTFALVALLVATRDRAATAGAPFALRHALNVLLVTAAIAAATEIAQIPGPRDASLADFARDVAGGLIALGWLAWRKDVAGHPGHGRRAVLVAAAVAAVSVGAPLAWCAAAYANRAAAFPELARFNSLLDLYFVSGGSFDRTAAGTLRVRLVQGPYPGVALDEPAPDWRGYTALRAVVTNPGDAPLLLTVRVHDRQHQNRYDDRYNGKFTLLPRTTTTLEIPLEQIAAAPRGRRLDLGHVAGVILFSNERAVGREFVLERVALN